MKQKRIVTIQDLSCIGKCSLGVALPIISALGIETAVIPTAILSTHTGEFKNYTFCYLTEEIPKISNHWSQQKFEFDAIYVGYLGSFVQLKLVEDFIDRFKGPETVVFVDPVMADNGELYSGFDRAYVKEMIKLIKEELPDYTNEGKLREHLIKMLKGEAGDRSGKIYGLGHAVYTMSDPRACAIRECATNLAKTYGRLDELELLANIEKLGCPLIVEQKNLSLPVCANVDLYSGFVYDMLGIPYDLYTPLFAIARVAGWCAHRMEEVISCKRIMRPAYRAAIKKVPYTPQNER